MTNDMQAAPATTPGATILDAIEPDLAQHLVSRREAIRRGATVSAGTAAALASGSIPVALAALSKEAKAQTTSVTDVVNFALMLEIFEYEFYRAVLNTGPSNAQNNAFAAVRTQIPATARPTLEQIAKHEGAHVAFLLANGASNILGLTADSFDFTGNRGAGNGPFARATSELAFLLLVAQAAEDTGVRAYKGQAPNLMSNPTVLEAALRIHSVEARHAAKIRRLRRATGGPPVLKFSGVVSGAGAGAAGANNISNPLPAAVAGLEAIYSGETAATQGGVTLSTLPNLPAGMSPDAFGEAFDEPLTRAAVVQIVQPFFRPTIPG